MSLRVQIALLVSIAVLSAYGLMSVISLVSDRTHTLEKSDIRLKLLSLYMADQLSSRFQNIAGQADLLAERISQKTPTYSKEVYDLMEQYYRINPEIYGGAIAFDEYKFTPHQRHYCLFLSRSADSPRFFRGKLDSTYDYFDASITKTAGLPYPRKQENLIGLRLISIQEAAMSGC